MGSLTESQRIAVLLEILGGPKYVSEVRAASAETRRLALQTRLAGREAAISTRRTALMQQGLYTLRRYSFFATVALVGATGAVVKLGYSYLSAMQNARVALSPVIRDQARLNGYLDQLFQISKYSPFVITDLAVAFRQLFAGLHPIGMGGGQIINLMQSITDFMSFAGKTGPGQLSRIALAIQHMAYAGRLTGYAFTQLGRLGVPVPAILESQLGIKNADSRTISKMNIPAQVFLAAMQRYSKVTPGIKNAARRLSMQTFSGILQVIRDSVSQVSGNFLTGAFGSQKTGAQGFLYGLAKPGGPLDKLAAVTNPRTGGSPSKGVLFISRQLTGTGGLGKGILLLTDIVKQLGIVFVRVLVPAFALALHSLILLWPALWILDNVLKQINAHATIFKFVFAILATEFVLGHTKLVGLYIAMKLFRIMTFGAVPGILKLITHLKILRTVELAGLIRRWKAYAFAVKAGGKAQAVWGTSAWINKGFWAKLSRAIITASLAVRTFAISAAAAAAPFIAWAAAIAAIIYGLRKLDEHMNPSRNMTQFKGGNLNPITWLAWPGQKILGRHAEGGFTRTRNVMVGEHGPEIAHLPFGTRITPAQSVKSIMNTGGSGAGGLTLYSTVVMPNGKVLADVVSKARTDKQATR